MNKTGPGRLNEGVNLNSSIIMGLVKKKVCGIHNLEEALLAKHMGADAIGLLELIPNDPASLNDLFILILTASMPKDTPTILLTPFSTAEEIVAHFTRTNTKMIQLMNGIRDSEVAKLRAALPDVPIIKRFKVDGGATLDQVLSMEDQIDGILLSNEIDLKGHPFYTGQPLDLKISRKIAEQAKKPVWLPGGEKEESVLRVIDEVHPHGVDLFTSIRTNGKLDLKKLERLLKKIP